MKKEHKFLALLLLGLFAVTIVAGAVSAAFEVKSLTDSLTNMFKKGTTTADFFKNLISPAVLFTVLIFLVVFAIISQLPFLKKGKEWIKTAIAVVVALLAGAFVDPSIFLPLINQYTALGVAISFVLPFILIFYFIKETVPRNRLIQRGIWGIYIVALLLSYIGNYDQIADNKLTEWIYWLMGIGALGMLIWGAFVLDRLWQNEVEEEVAQVEASALNKKYARLQEIKTLKGTATGTILEGLIDEEKRITEELKSLKIIR